MVLVAPLRGHRPPTDRKLSHGVLHRLDAERPELRAAAVHAQLGSDADLQHDGRVELRARQLLHGRRLCGLQHRRPGGLLARAHRRAAGGRRTRRALRALLPAPRAQVRPCARTADHLRPGLRGAGTGAADLGPYGGRLQAARAAARAGVHLDQFVGRRPADGGRRGTRGAVPGHGCGGARGLLAVPGDTRLHDAGGAGDAAVACG